MTFFFTLIFILTPIYVYIGYPVLLFLIRLIYKKPHIIDESKTPKVTLIVSCYNEVEVIKEKMANCQNIDYPADVLEIIFISDGSTDGTDELIKEYCNDQIKLIRQEGRLGKTSGLNLGVAAAAGELIVFSDANAMYQENAIKKLVRHFADSNVGLVVGAAIYTDGDDNSAAQSENSYWEYELTIKRWESDIHSVVGGDGAIYAIRRSLYDPLDAKDINDFVNPLEIIAKGYRGIFDREAICLEETAGDFNKEARRKERIVNRSFRGLMKVKRVMNPFITGFFALEIISHKLLRWLIPFFLIGIAITSIIHSYQGMLVFQILYFLEMLFLWLAIIGFLQHQKQDLSKAFFIPYYFLMVNYFSMIGVIKALSGNIQVTWSSPRQNLNNQKISAKAQFIAFLLAIAPVFIAIDFLS